MLDMYECMYFLFFFWSSLVESFTDNILVLVRCSLVISSYNLNGYWQSFHNNNIMPPKHFILLVWNYVYIRTSPLVLGFVPYISAYVSQKWKWEKSFLHTETQRESGGGLIILNVMLFLVIVAGRQEVTESHNIPCNWIENRIVF